MSLELSRFVELFEHAVGLPPALPNDHEQWGVLPSHRDDIAPDVQQELVILSSFYRADDDEMRSPFDPLGPRVYGKIPYPQPGSHRWRHGLAMPFSKVCKLVEGRSRISNYACRAGKSVAQPNLVLFGLALATILRMRKRDQVVDEIDGPKPATCDPTGQRRFVETGMTDVEVNRAGPREIAQRPKRRPDREREKAASSRLVRIPSVTPAQKPAATS